jgi:lipopolysaccharide export system protein LptA
MQFFTLATGARITYLGGGVDARCIGQGNRLVADSAEHYEDRGEVILIDRVRFTDERVAIQSQRMVYYTTDERIHATGDVRGKMTNGTRFTGPEMFYWRAKPGLREQPRWRAPGRPFVRMAPDSTAKTQSDSTDLTADLVVSENDSLMWAVGQVAIERPDLRATADSATMNRITEHARLMRTPRIAGRGERPFKLAGEVVDLWSKDQKLERVLSSGAASVSSDSLQMRGDTVDLRLRDQRIQRAFTWGTRAYADGSAQQMEADSLDIHLPDQRIREVHAVGKAIAYSTVDSVKILSDERDWIAGDTLLALFDSVAAGDTSSTARMKQVTATGDARSFYQLAPSSGERGVPNINYNRGREIVVSFTEGEVELVKVKDRASGIYLEPPVVAKPKATDKATDKAKVPADSAGATTVPPAAKPAAKPAAAVRRP